MTYLLPSYYLSEAPLEAGFPLRFNGRYDYNLFRFQTKMMKIVRLEDAPWNSVSHNQGIKKRILLDNDDIPGITTLSQAIFRPGDVADGHAHTDMTEVFMVTAGTGAIRLNGTEYELHPGVVAVAEANDTHEIANTGTVDLILTYFGVKS